ncbi:MAG: alpha/beta hydrolase domain-containing protein [Acidimicrobiia bacterium]
MRSTGRRPLVLAAVALVLVAGACTGDGGSEAAPPSTEATTTTTTTAPPPEPPDVEVEGPIAGTPQTSGADGLAEVGYLEEEYFISGTATAYEPEGELADDGRWDLAEAEAAPYATRILVKRPADPADASGVVVVEWNNVSIGSDGTPDWTFTRDEIVRAGHVHVAVSAQEAGVDRASGGITGAGGNPLTQADPERYGGLDHPGDPWSYDIFGQVGQLVRTAPEVSPDVLGGIDPEVVLAVGESQSAFRLTSYVNGVHPIEGAYDGFLVHSRGGGAAPFVDDAGLGSALAGQVAIRDDVDVPVLVFTTETDLTLLGYWRARQPDSEHVRSWDVAGTAHADAFLLGGDAVGAGTALGCGAPVNDGPQHLALKAALARLVEWARDGTPPPSGTPIEVDADGAIVRDADGNAEGGVRLPALEVPAATLSGEPVGDSVLCRLFGSTVPFPIEILVERYGSREAYLERVDEAIEAAVDAGFLLQADSDAARAEAEEAWPGPTGGPDRRDG